MGDSHQVEIQGPNNGIEFILSLEEAESDFTRPSK
jgi:hypothetical protein